MVSCCSGGLVSGIFLHTKHIVPRCRPPYRQPTTTTWHHTTCFNLQSYAPEDGQTIARNMLSWSLRSINTVICCVWKSSGRKWIVQMSFKWMSVFKGLKNNTKCTCFRSNDYCFQFRDTTGGQLHEKTLKGSLVINWSRGLCIILGVVLIRSKVCRLICAE
jgi:hypothetical protein